MDLISKEGGKQFLKTYTAVSKFNEIHFIEINVKFYCGGSNHKGKRPNHIEIQWGIWIRYSGDLDYILRRLEISGTSLIKMAQKQILC